MTEKRPPKTKPNGAIRIGRASAEPAGTEADAPLGPVLIDGKPYVAVIMQTLSRDDRGRPREVLVHYDEVLDYHVAFVPEEISR